MRYAVFIAVMSTAACLFFMMQPRPYTQIVSWDGVPFSQAVTDCPVAKTCWVTFEGVRAADSQKLCIGEYAFRLPASQVSFAYDVRLAPGQILFSTSGYIWNGRCAQGIYRTSHATVTMSEPGPHADQWTRFLNPQLYPDAPTVLK